MIGPRAYQSASFSAPVGVPGSEPGRVSKRRVVLLLVVVFALLTQLPTQRVNGESFSGHSTGSCVTDATVLYSGPALGYARYSIHFRVSLADASTVQWGWSHSGGQLGAQAWLHGPVLWNVTSGNPPYQQSAGAWEAALIAVLDPGSTGTVSFTIRKAASYGGCYSVDNVVVERIGAVPGPTPPPNGGGFSTATPLPSGASAEPGATTTAAPTGSCAPDASYTVPEGCTAPPGYCYVPIGLLGFGLVTMVPCGGSPTPPPSPSPSAPPAYCSGGWDADAGGCVQVSDQWGSDQGSIDVGPARPWTLTLVAGRVYHGEATLTASAGSRDSTACHAQWRTGGSISDIVNDGDCRIATPTAVAWSSWGGGTFTGNPADGYEYGGGSQSRDLDFSTDVNCCSGSLITFTWTVKVWVVNADGSPCTGGGCPSPGPTATPSSSASAGASGPPSLPPGWYPPGFSSPEPLATGPVNICGPGPTIAACRTAGPDGSGDIFGGYDPDPSGLLDRLAQKVPFGYVSQMNGDLQGLIASPGSAKPDLCGDFDFIGHTLTFCIPDEPFTYVAQWRWVGVGIVWLWGLIALWRIAESSVGNPTGWGK